MESEEQNSIGVEALAMCPRSAKCRVLTIGNIDRAEPSTDQRFHCVVSLTRPGRYAEAGTAVRLGPRHMLTAAHCLNGRNKLSVRDLARGMDPRATKPIKTVYLEDDTHFDFDGRTFEIDQDGRSEKLAVVELAGDLLGATAKVDVLSAPFPVDTFIATGVLLRPDTTPVIKVASARVFDNLEDTIIVRNDDDPSTGFSYSSGTPMFRGDRAQLTVVGILSRVKKDGDRGYYSALSRKRVSWLSKFLPNEE